MRTRKVRVVPRASGADSDLRIMWGKPPKLNRRMHAWQKHQGAPDYASIRDHELSHERHQREILVPSEIHVK
jgi:hypothetical protein